MELSKSELSKQGPFPNHFDPWLEKGHYFHQFHAHVLTTLFNSLVDSVMGLGYVLGREASVQIVNSEPDLFVRQPLDNPLPSRNFAAAILEIGLEVGETFEIDEEAELDRLFIKSVETGRVVTVLELVSPGNKNDEDKIQRYQARRQKLINNAIDIVEIDLTRSFKHLINNKIAQSHPYHIAIHQYDSSSRYWGMELEEPLKSFPLPLEGKAIPVELNRIYRQSYSELRISWQMFNDKHYTAENLPFPTTLSEEEREKLMAALDTWKNQLK